MEKLKGYYNNINLYKKYKMFSYDLLFYNAISVLFFTMTKGFSMAEVMYMTAAFSLFAFIWQIPSNFLIEKLGVRNSAVLGNILVVLEVFAYIIVPQGNIRMVFIADFFAALGWALKSTAEGTILYSSLKKVNEKDNFSKVEGKANSKYYFYDAVASAISGFLFVFDNYLPMIFCLINTVIAAVISYKFVEVEYETDEPKVTLRDLKSQFIEILYSNRSKAIFMFAFIFAGVVGTTQKLYNSILIDLNLGEEYITIILSIATIFTGIGAKYSYSIQNKAKNKTLTVFTILYMIATLFIGLIGISNHLNVFSLSMYMIFLIIMCFIQGSYRVALKKYILNFTNHNVRTKVTSLYYLFEYCGKAVLVAICGVLLNYMNNSVATLVFGIAMCLLCYLCLNFMKDKVGLKPDEYDSSEIYGYKVKK